LLDREQKASIIDIMKSSKIRKIFGGEKVFIGRICCCYMPLPIKEVKS